jgi:hypothetical protein
MELLRSNWCLKVIIAAEQGNNRMFWDTTVVVIAARTTNCVRDVWRGDGLRWLIPKEYQ